MSQAPIGSANGIWFRPLPIAAQSYATVRLQDAWARYCRALILMSAQGRVRTTSGQLLPASNLVQSAGGDALTALKLTYPRSRQSRPLWEPKWFDANEAYDAAARLQIANLSTVSAITATGNALDDLRMCRNFLAHRGQTSSAEVDQVRRRMGVSLNLSVEDLMNIVVLPGTTSLFEVWCDELLQKATNAAK